MQVPARIAFIHVPKCAGTAVAAALAKNFAQECTQKLDSWSSRAAAEAAHVPLHEYRRELLQTQLNRRQPRLIHGHYTVDRDIVEQFGSRWSFVTLLRDPVERWLSHYFYNLGKSNDHFRIEEDLDAFLDTPRAAQLGRQYASCFAPRSLNASDAVHALKSFRVVGCVEQLDAFVDTIETELQMRLDVERLRVNPLDPSTRQALASESVRRRVAELCAADRQIYDAVIGSGRG